MGENTEGGIQIIISCKFYEVYIKPFFYPKFEEKGAQLLIPPSDGWCLDWYLGKPFT